jgi:hypothetical protein
MDGTPRTTHPAEVVVLWRRGGMTCTCRTHSPDRVEIRLVVVGVVVHSQSFSDTDAASQFAIEKMHAYDGAGFGTRARR